MNMKEQLTFLGAILLLKVLERTTAFLPSTITTSRSYRVFDLLTIHSSSPPEPDDSFQDEQSLDEGEELAKKFYEQIQKREMKGSSASSASTDEVKKNESFRSDSGENPEGQPKKKFTGKSFAQSQSEPSPFVQNNGSLFDDQRQRRTPRDEMREREFNLVGRAETAIPFQAALAFGVLCFYIYVGFTGGIKSETDFSIDELDDYTEQVIPQPRDTEPSYWL